MTLNKNALTPVTFIEEDKAYLTIYSGKGPQGNVPQKVKVSDFRKVLIQDLDILLTPAQILASGAFTPITILSTPPGYYADFLDLKVMLRGGSTPYATNTTANIVQTLELLVEQIDLEDPLRVYKLTNLGADGAGSGTYGSSDADITFYTIGGNPTDGNYYIRITGSYILRRIFPNA